MRIAQIVPSTEAEGPGVRTAIWTQGCSIRCPACCNPEFFAATGGTEYSIPDLVQQILDSGSDGLTLLGGEPLNQPENTTALAQAVQAVGKSVIVFSGYYRPEVEHRAPDLLKHVDVLVDGPFDHKLLEKDSPVIPRRWLGSSNQGLHFITDRYCPQDFYGRNTVELRWSHELGTLTMNGWPVTQYLSKNLPRKDK